MPVEPVTIEFTPNPTQQAFIQSRARAALFSGRMREGKSAGLAWVPFYHTRYNPGARWLVIRDTWVNLQRTTFAEFCKWFPPGVMGHYTASTKTYSWACTLDGQEMIGEVLFMGLDDPNDAGKLQSLTIAGFVIDEVAPAMEAGGVPQDIFTVAMTRLSQTGMKWMGGRLAENNPDEDHWTYSLFVDPGTEGYEVFQPTVPENVHNLSIGYYQQLKRDLAGRPDLWRRFGEGKFGFTQLGKAITPEWRDDVHLSYNLRPLRGTPLYLLWDFGLNPTCIVSQVTPLGNWNILWCEVGEGIGASEYIADILKPVLNRDYPGYDYKHIGDPSGTQREQSSSEQSAVRVIRKEIGGPYVSGPRSEFDRIQPLRAVLGKHNLIHVDRVRARPIWKALRGGWHRHTSTTGVVGAVVKDIHSHPGDALGYGAAILYPVGRLLRRSTKLVVPVPSILTPVARSIPEEMRRLPAPRRI